MRLRLSCLQLLQFLRSEMRSGLQSLRSEMRSCSSGLRMRRPGVQFLQSLQLLHRWKSLRSVELWILRRQSRLRSCRLRSGSCCYRSDSCGTECSAC